VLLTGLQLLVTCAPLDAASWGAIGLLGVGLFTAVEVEKWLLRRSGMRRP
jgi:hypothetical protein